MREIYTITLILILSFSLFAAPTLLRWSGNIPGVIGVPSYMHLRIAKMVHDGNFNWHDPLSYGGRTFTYTPGAEFLLALSGFMLPIELASVLLFALIGSLSILLFYFISKNFGNAKLSVLMFALTPAIIVLFSHIDSRAPGIFMGLLALYLITKSEKNIPVAAIVLGISSFFHAEPFLFFSFLS
ncbi:MAG: hypothetical protein V1802_02035, partial [Candidatus Aenigmatarchaeota archaeon]